MKGSRAILEMLERYNVSDVFGLIGETSFPLYKEWDQFDGVKHITGRDERNVAIMADGYARASFRPGVCEGPGVGASYLLPGIAEAYSSGVPMIVFTSDIPINSEKKNVLTEYDKNKMFSAITKETLTVYNGSEIPRLLRRAFRLATSGRAGPVHIRVPMNAYNDDVEESEIYSQSDFSSYPSIRTSPDDERLRNAIALLKHSKNPVIICGQGVLFSQAWNEVRNLAETFGIPVGTTISGKGSFPEEHPLSIGVIGSRGGTKFSNSVINESDLVFFIGTNTDSASTSEWKVPSKEGKRTIIHLDVNEAEIGNNYRTDLFLLGDAKLTISRMLEMVNGIKPIVDSSELSLNRANFQKYVDSLVEDNGDYVNPLVFVKALQNSLGNENIIAADPGIGAIYSSAYFRTKEAGRRFIFNYSVGGLGFALPAAIGAYFARNKTTVCLTTDGSFSFVEGELETIKRYGAEIKIIIFNNRSFGWIRATMAAHYGKVLKGTDFFDVDYSKIAEAYKMDYHKITGKTDVEKTLKEVLNSSGSSIIEVPNLPEDKLFPPVPEWKEASSKLGVKYMG